MPPATTAPRPRPGRGQDILRVFTEKLAESGYDGTSISAVASELGLSKGTVMHHYGSKDRLLQQTMLGYMQRRNAEVIAIRKQFGDPEQRLAAIIVAMVTAHRDDRAATIAFSRELMRFANDPVMDEVRLLRRDFTNEVRRVIEDGMAAGTFRRGDSTLAALQIIGACNWLWTWLEPGGRLGVDEIAHEFVGSMLGGLLYADPPDPGTTLDFVAELRAATPA